MNINERIKTVRKETGLNQTDFAEKIGISMNGLSMLERGVNNPSKQTIDLICREFHISKVWLETGEGEMEEPELDEFAVLAAELLQNKDDFVIRAYREFLKVYLKMDPQSKRVMQDIIRQYIEALKKDPE